MTYQPHQSEDVTMKPVAGMNIDEAALKAERAVHKNHLPDLHYVLNVLEKVREFMLPKLTPEDAAHGEIAASITGMKYIIRRTKEADTVVPAEQAEDSAMLDWLEREHFSLSAIKEPCGDDQFALWWQVTQGRKSISGHPLASPREAIRAAIGRNREAGGS